MRHFFCLLLIALSISFYAGAQCTTFVHEDFETGGFVGTTTSAGGTYTQTYPTSGAAQGTTYLQNTGGGSSLHWEGILQTFTPGQPEYISFYVRTDNNTLANSYVIIGDANTTTNLGMFWCYFSSNGNLRVYNGTTYYDVATVINQWYHVEITNIDWTGYQFDITVDGTVLGTNVPFRSGPISNVDRMYLYNFTGTEGYYDQIIIGDAPVEFTATTGTILCNGDSTNIDLTVTLGTAPFTYSWSNGANTEDLTLVPAGTYDVTVTDNNGCSSTASYTLTEPTAITSTASITPAASCAGTGDIDLTVSGGAGGYTFLWGNGANTEDITAVAPGTYDVTITDANSCTYVGSYTVSVAAAGFYESFEGGGAGGFDNVWTDLSGGGYSQVFPNTGAAAGSYYMENTGLSGHNGGLWTTFPASQPSTISYWMRTASFANSHGYVVIGSSGTTANVCVSFCYFSAAGNLRFYNDVTGFDYPAAINTWYFVELRDIDWTNKHFDVYINGVLELTDYAFRNTALNDVREIHLYNLTATSTALYDDILIGGASSSITLSATTGTILCNGDTSGINLTVSGSAGPFTYTWSNGASTEDLTGVLAGTYEVTVSDGSCSATGSYTLTEPTVLSVTPTVTPIACNGGTGKVKLAVSGGTPGYTYAWSNGHTVDSVIVAAGTYVVTVYDVNGCTYQDTFTLAEPTAITVADTITHATCGATTGSITVTPSGGTPLLVASIPMYDYTWSTGATSSGPDGTLSGVAPGTYTVTVTDMNNCSYSNSYTINSASLPTLSAVVDNILCFGGTANIDLTVNGGSGSPTFTWSNGPVTEDNTGLVAGTYNVTVIDGSCTVTGSYTVAAGPSAITVTPIVANALCNGGTGSVTLNTSGGTPGYTYGWSNGGNTNSITAVAPGTYHYTVTDDNGCTYVDSATITEPAALTVADTITHVLCNGGTGSIVLTPSGGTPGYTYIWSNGNNTNSLTAVVAGTYDVTVTDANNCVFTTSYTITEPTVLTVTGTVLNASCNGGSGNVELTVTGGTPVYTYNWSNGGNTNTINAVPAGTYDVTVTEANGCSFTGSYTVTEPALLVATGTATNAICFGGTGSAVVTATGGTTPYSYLWSNGLNTDTITGITPGAYSVTVTDVNGCFDIVSLTIGQPADINVHPAYIIPQCYGGTGSIVLAPSGGTTPYTYLWSNGNNSSSLTGVAAGNYTVTVTDGGGCTYVRILNLQQPAELLVTPVVNNASCSDGRGDILLLVSGGTGSYTYNWTNGATSINLISVLAGTYGVTVTDANGCIKTGTYTIAQPAPLTVTPTITGAQCNGGTGSISVAVSGGTGIYTYNWSNGDTTTGFSNVPAGTYHLTVTDAGSCSFTASYVINNPGVVTIDETITNAACNGGTGSVSVNVTGGTSPFTYAWSNGGNASSITAVAPGGYSLTVTDANGCSATGGAYTVTEPATPLVVTVDTIIDDYGNGLGAVHTSTSGGVTPYTYQWNNGNITPNLGAVSAGNYHLTVTDAAGCTVMASAQVDLEIVGINDPVAVVPADIHVWPNPFENGFSVALHNFTQGDVEITLMDINGRVVYSQGLWVTGVEAQVDIRETLASGIYFLNVRDSENSITRKLVRE